MNIREQILAFQAVKAPVGLPSAIDPDDMITVSSTSKRIAFAYERFRNVLEPDEADILRRKAIRRMLDRRLHEDRSPHLIATAILQEMIRAHYIEPVSRSAAVTIGEYIRRAVAVEPYIPSDASELFLNIVAVAIDRELFPRQKEEAFINLMYQDIYHRTIWADNLLSTEDQPIELYIACHRALFAADDNEIMYHFFLNHYPWWKTEGLSEEQVAAFTNDLPTFITWMKRIMHHSARERLYRIIRPVAVPYRIIWDMVTEGSDTPWQSEEGLVKAATTTIATRIEHIQQRMSRRAWHAILFLFFTKTLVGVFLEVPYEIFLFGRPHFLSLFTNIAFHPLLLFVASITVRMPGQRNTDKIIDHVKRIITGEGDLPNIMITKPRRYGAITWALFATVYTALFLLIFWRLFIVLDQLQFSLLAIMIFVAFLGLVSFLSVRIRRSVEDIRVIPKREGFFGLLISFISLPILEFGRWLTSHIAQLNVFIFLMDLVLEAPFKLIIDVFEEWVTFIRDRKEEIV